MSDLNVGQTATITARNRQAPFQYQIQDYHPFSMAMKKMGGIGRLSGGRDVLERFAYQSTGTAAWMPESGEISLAQRQIADEAVFGGGAQAGLRLVLRWWFIHDFRS